MPVTFDTTPPGVVCRCRLSDDNLFYGLLLDFIERMGLILDFLEVDVVKLDAPDGVVISRFEIDLAVGKVDG